jgi:squalene synthase HpnC
MTATTVQLLDQFGPTNCDVLSQEQARQWCSRLTTGRYENFSVLSAVVPGDLRDDFAAVYAFCRWADDLGDEVGDRARSLELLAWWRRELEQCFASEPRHPVFRALEPTIRKHNLPIKPFDDLIRAFEQDQSVNRYDTWEQLIGYCRLSADPVGRLVLMMCGKQSGLGQAGAPQTSSATPQDLFPLSDCICTALQLTNHWQDVRRDIVERDRIYIPRELMPATDFESRLVASAKQGWGVDHRILEESRRVVRACADRTWPLYERGAELLDLVEPRTRPMVWLFASGGQHVLRMIHLWSYESMLHRPKLGKIRRVMLIAQAWLAARRSQQRKAATR